MIRQKHPYPLSLRLLPTALIILLSFLPIKPAQAETNISEGTELVKSASKLQKQRQLGDKFMIWGETALWVGTGASIEFNDNIRLVENGKESDIIFRPNVFLSLEREFTEINTLNISAKLGFSFYLKNPENNTRLFNVSPDSSLVYSFQINTIKINIAESFSLQEDPTSSPVLSGVAIYRRYTNSFSIGPTWNINPHWDTSLTISHNLLRTIGSRFSEQERDTFSASYSLKYKPTESFSIGSFLSATTTKYKQNIQNDSSGGTVGLQSGYTFSEYLTADVFVGHEIAKFRTSGSINDNSNAGSFTFKAGLKHRLTPHTNHNLNIEGGIRPGFGTNFFNNKKYTYSIDNQFNAFTKGIATLFYESIKESGTQGEEAARLALLLNANFAIMKNASFSTSYRFLIKDSNQANKSYQENKFTFDFSYAF